jgi:energy-coupling factor transport system permease protein
VLKRGLTPVTLFLIFTFISNVLFQEGRVAAEFLGLRLTDEGLMRGGQLTLRLFILILGAKVLTATTGAEELVTGMGGLLGPVGRLEYVKELINTMSLTLRILPIIYDEAMELYKDVKNSDGRGLRDRMKLAVELLTTLFERSLKKAREMSENDRGETGSRV